MPWLQVTFCSDRERAPLVEAALESAGALALTLGDAGNEPQLEPPPGTTPLWREVTITALFPDEPQSLAATQALAHSLSAQLTAEPLFEQIQDQAWERAWMEHFAPARFGRRLWVCPKGQPAGDPNAVVVQLDPGLAFGTGNHPTTALCLRWLDGRDLKGKSVIDFGCGSGILAIAALKLGANRATAVDHDPQALDATGDNAQQNAVAGRLHSFLPEEIPEEPADLLLANILAGPLVELAPRLAGLVRPDGLIALSGILIDQVGRIETAYKPRFALDAAVTEDDWVLLSGRRIL